MGLAVLPSRLSGEIRILEDALISGKAVADIPAISHHAEWAEELISRHPEMNADNVRAIIEEGIGEVFLKVLLDAGVFKRCPEGKAAFMRFIKEISGEL